MASGARACGGVWYCWLGAETVASSTLPAYDPRCCWLPPRKPLPSRAALALQMGLRPFRQVADTWSLRPADNQPNPCGTEVTTPPRSCGRSVYDTGCVV